MINLNRFDVYNVAFYSFEIMQQFVDLLMGMMAKVVPSPSGLMVQGGGGRGGGITIDTLNIYGVQDIQSLYNEIQKQAQRQSHAVGVW